MTIVVIAVGTAVLPETMIAVSTPAMTTRKIPPATIQMVPDELRSAG